MNERYIADWLRDTLVINDVKKDKLYMGGEEIVGLINDLSLEAQTGFELFEEMSQYFKDTEFNDFTEEDFYHLKRLSKGLID